MVSQTGAFRLVCLASGVLLAAGVSFRVFGAGDEAVETVPAAGELAGALDVLLRGQMHEGFATPVSLNVEPGTVVPKQPPPPITEVPPDVRPEGDDVQWIPGYWSWDDASKDFVWTSGLWRHAPPGRRWVPGYGAEAAGGWRWQAGTWVEADATALDYLPPPQESLERGPTTEAPSENDVWAPGCWMYVDAGYRWRPGFWLRGRPGWCWVPDHYVWSPYGVIFVRGYWDYPLDVRGIPFCPVAFHGTPYLAAGFRYTPRVVIDTSSLLTQLFVRPQCHYYCFGDYYDDRFLGQGIYPFYERVNRRYGYDPLLTYYRWDSRRQGFDFDKRLIGWHEYYQKKPDLRPLHTFPVPGGGAGGSKLPLGSSQTLRPVLGKSLDQLVKKPDSGKRFVPVTSKEMQTVNGMIGSMTSLSNHRKTVEISGSPGARNSVGGVAKAGTGKPYTVLRPITDPPLGNGSGQVRQSTGGGTGATGSGKKLTVLKLPAADPLLGNSPGQTIRSGTGTGGVTKSDRIQNSSKSSTTTQSSNSGSRAKGTTRVNRGSRPSVPKDDKSKR